MPFKPADNSPESPPAGLGTFAGVFTPSILTILGIILFLRLSYVVGHAGLFRAFMLIGIANLISILTSFSVAAVATNMKVKGGGDYYLISRTLGLEFGGAIGLLLFCAQSVSIAFYCIGFGESVNQIIGGAHAGHTPQMIAGAALVFLFFLAWVGADLATKFQYLVMAFLVLALISFYLGGLGKWDTQTLIRNLSSPDSGMGFWALFAIFFPAVTGFTQGVSMSGDLEDPGKSLPAGTFTAVFFSIVVYFSVALVFAATSPLAVLASDLSAMKKTAAIGGLIDAGVIAATLSSAMASFLGAPRILQSLSADKIFSFLTRFGRGYGPSNNPRQAVLLSFVIALIAILFGELDKIAGIVSMFFLISYGLLNYATYYEATAQSPSFRPRFKWYHRQLSLLGFLACAGTMLAIDFKTGIAAAAILTAIFQYLKRTASPARFSDSKRSHHLKIIREHILATRHEPEHPREWRPFILALSDDSHDMAELLDFATLIEGKSGMTTAVQVIQGRGYRAAKQKEAVQNRLSGLINEHGWPVFPLVVTTDDLSVGLPVVFQSYGIGPVRANTILVNWHRPGDPDKKDPETIDYRDYLGLALQHECNILLVDQKDGDSGPAPPGEEKTIDVWWENDDTSRLMILLAYLTTRNPGWDNARIRLIACHPEAETPENLETLKEMLEEIRIDAAPHLLPKVDAGTIVNTSKGTDLVFIPARLTGGRTVILAETPGEAVIPHLKTVVLTRAASRIDLTAEPEAGRPAELARLLDALEGAEKRVALAEKNALTAAKAATGMMQSVNIEETLAAPEVMTTLKQALAARDMAREARNKAKEERSKLVELSEKAREEGLRVELPPVPDPDPK